MYMLALINPLTAEFCDDNLSTSTLPESVGYLCSRIFTCCHQTYNYSRPWSASPSELPLVTRNDAHSGAPPPQSGWTTQFNGVYQVANTACSHKVHSWGAWALDSTQTHKLVQFMPVQKPYKCCNEGEGLYPFEPCCPPSHTPRV